LFCHPIHARGLATSGHSDLTEREQGLFGF
jgi:hypothetical protein